MGKGVLESAGKQVVLRTSFTAGPIPPGLGKLASLVSLNLRENELSGESERSCVTRFSPRKYQDQFRIRRGRYTCMFSRKYKISPVHIQISTSSLFDRLSQVNLPKAPSCVDVEIVRLCGAVFSILGHSSRLRVEKAAVHDLEPVAGQHVRHMIPNWRY